jgi:N-acetylmuramoyl-L-alanine amidase
MKIRIASIMLAFGLIAPLATVAYAAEALPEGEPDTSEVLLEQTEPTAVFYLDGEPLEHVDAQSISGTYYVTLSSILPLIDSTTIVEDDGYGTATVTAEASVVTEAAALVEGDEDALMEGETVTVLDTLTMTAQAGQRYVVANGRYLYVEDAVIRLNGAVAVPIRVVAEAMNLTAEYDADTGLVHLTRSAEVGYLEDGTSYYNADDLYWLSRIVSCESGNQPLVGKIAVANVVLNRVRSSRFPDTVYDVIFQKNQFGPASSGSIYREPNEESVIAAKLAMDGAEALDNVLFFNRAGLSCYASKNRSYVATIGGHAFYA